LRLRQSLVEILRREATRLMISVAEARELEDLMETVPEEFGHRG
jgi:hypothetical protein